ncbi:MAG: hypothetical protein RIQ88_386 [Actinomycetota bacterium]
MNKSLKLSAVLSLIGLSVMWFGLMIGNYVKLIDNPYSDHHGIIQSGYPGMFRPSTYVFLVAIAGFALLSALAFRKADAELAVMAPGALPVVRFNGAAVVTSLVSMVIFVLSLFFASFNGFQGSNSVSDQILGIYLPILLGAGVCVFSILSVTVYRKSITSAENVSAEDKKAKREAALAFVYPIVGTTIALIIGLIVYQAQRNNPQTWAWVLILAIVAVSIILGSIYSGRARAHGASVPKPIRIPGTAALNLNFVLVVIFVVIVSIMSLTFGLGAISSLDHSYEYFPKPAQRVASPTFGWFVKDMLPAILMLLLVEVSAYIAVRIRSIVAQK